MEKTKFKLIEFIMNKATEEQLDGLEQLIFQNDVNYGLELFLGGEYLDGYLATQAQMYLDNIKEYIKHALAELSNENIRDAEKLLNEALDE